MSANLSWATNLLGKQISFDAVCYTGIEHIGGEVIGFSVYKDGKLDLLVDCQFGLEYFKSDELNGLQIQNV